MSRLFWLNAVLIVVVAALGIIAYFRPAGDAPSAYPLSGLKPGDIHAIRIERQGTATIALERKESGWFLTAPFAARADETRLRQLLGIVEARSLHRLAALDLGRFELAQPAVRVTLGGQSFGFGLVNAATREQYVMTGDSVYAVDPRYGTALPAHALDLASRRLLGPGEHPLRIELAGFAVEQREGKWVLSPSPADLGQDDLVRWVDGWRLASAVRVEQVAAEPPRPDVRIRLKSGGGFTLGVAASGEQLILTRSDEKMRYHFRAAIARRLLSPPTPAPEERSVRN